MVHTNTQEECEAVERERDGFRVRVKELEKRTKAAEAEVAHIKARYDDLTDTNFKLDLALQRAERERDAAKAAKVKGEPCPGYRKAVFVEPDGTIIFEQRHCVTCQGAK